MSFLSSMDISSSALTAQRFRMDTIAQNLSNIMTTRDAQGEPYRRRVVIMQERAPQFSDFFGDALRDDNNNPVAAAGGRGVRIVSVEEDPSPFRMEYNPDHPDSDDEGYVAYPNVDLAVEMVDMMSATRSYEANITAFNAIKGMAMQALDIGK